MYFTLFQLKFIYRFKDVFCFPETVSDSQGGWSQTILEVKMLDVEVLDWCGYTWSVLGCTVKFSEKPLEMAYGREMNIQFTATALVDIPAVSMPIARSLKTSDICGIVLCDKAAHFRAAFYCGQSKAHLCNNHAV